jgi:hypothetical protein
MIRTNRPLATFVVAATAVFGFTACGGSDGDSSADSSDSSVVSSGESSSGDDAVAAITKLLTDSGAPQDEAECVAGQMSDKADITELAKLIEAGQTGNLDVNIDAVTAVAFNDAVVACGLG